MSEIPLNIFFSDRKEKVFSFLIPPVGKKGVRGISLVIVALLMCALSACNGSEADLETVCERTEEMPLKLKMDHYRGITPACVPDGQTLDIAALQTLQKSQNLVLIDVWAIVRSVDDGFGSMWLPNEDHYSLPGTTWLPNVGYGKIKPDIERYLKDNLVRLTEGDKAKPLVFFCVADCWMSWNTVQRVGDYGYDQVYWFKDGTDGWDELGLPLVKVEPVEIPESYY